MKRDLSAILNEWALNGRQVKVSYEEAKLLFEFFMVGVNQGFSVEAVDESGDYFIVRAFEQQ